MPNPKKKLPADLKSLARAYTDLSLNTLGTIVANGSEGGKIAAIQQLLDRGWGRPVSKTEHTGEDGGDIRITIRNIIAKAEAKKK